jgi:hypothetical protein
MKPMKRLEQQPTQGATDPAYGDSLEFCPQWKHSEHGGTNRFQILPQMARIVTDLHRLPKVRAQKNV